MIATAPSRLQTTTLRKSPFGKARPGRVPRYEESIDGIAGHRPVSPSLSEAGARVRGLFARVASVRRSCRVQGGAGSRVR